MTADKQIEDILARFGEPMAGSTWKVQGNTVIFHKTLERIAAHAGITWDQPTIVRAEADEAVILVTGRIKIALPLPANAEPGSLHNVETDERVEWSIGEARIDVNYRISGRQAAYPYAMAEKRAKDRVILKLIGAHGLLYSEEEADEFRNGRPGSSGGSISWSGGGGGSLGGPMDGGGGGWTRIPSAEASEIQPRGHTAAEPAAPVEPSPYVNADRPTNFANEPLPKPPHDAPAKSAFNAASQGTTHTTKGEPVTHLNVPFGPTDQEAAAYTKAEIDRHVTVAGVTEYMLNPETQKRLNDMPAALRDECRDHAKARLMALGWTGKKAS